MIDSVETSVNGLKLFSSIKTASYAHIFKSEFVDFPMSECKKLENIDPIRFSQDPYPENDRPRGNNDLLSVKYHRKIIQKEGHTSPIWIAKKGNRYIKLDGVHRIVAAHLEKKRSIPAYIVKVD